MAMPTARQLGAPPASEHPSYPTVAAITFTSLVLTTTGIVLVGQLPDDPYHLAWHLQLYLVFCSIEGALGCVGWWTSNAQLLGLFSNALLLDVAFSALPRMAAMVVLKQYTNPWCNVYRGSAAAAQSRLRDGAQQTDLSPHAAVQPDSTVETVSPEYRTCVVTLHALHVAALGCMVLAMVLQLLAGLVVRKYARSLAQAASQVEFEHFDDAAEKHVLAMEDDDTITIFGSQRS